ncbi:uncharacterized protein [Miscanthus floridulus]|uniref:uncharacterized protein isoform X2 n=1 Tax=Miscanthus floridulus TaxID=154761 RepID=UPI00345B273B
MRIRKRPPARAASPGPPPPPLPLQQPMEKPREEEGKEAEEEEKRPILAAGVRDDDRVRPAAAAPASGNRNRNSATDDVPKPEPQDAAATRCSRNDGKRWRCKKAAVPGYLFCDRHVAWSTRKRKPRAKEPKSHGSGVLEPTTTIPKKFAEDHGETQRNAGFFGGF